MIYQDLTKRKWMFYHLLHVEVVRGGFKSQSSLKKS